MSLIKVVSIQKASKDFKLECEKYQKLIKTQARLEICELYPKNVLKASGEKEAKLAYEEAFLPYKKGFCVVLDERGEDLDSKEFAKLLKDKSLVTFFIGGAYGLNPSYTKSFDKSIRLSSLTLAHKLANCLLLEQIYRGLCINSGHPYHK